jgi:hypothetical protein
MTNAFLPFINWMAVFFVSKSDTHQGEQDGRRDNEGE